MKGLKIPLRELQRDMQRHLLGEESEVTAAIVDAPPLPAADRLAIYRNAYQVRLIDALHETYPVLHGLLGDEAWVEMGQAYVAAHPSVFRSIRWYGRELADHLALHETYPVLHGLLGDEAWVEMGQAYVAAHPSVFRSIRWYGRELADHLALSTPYSEAPILSEGALLEWTLAEVFDAADAPALARSALAAVEPSA